MNTLTVLSNQMNLLAQWVMNNFFNNVLGDLKLFKLTCAEHSKPKDIEGPIFSHLSFSILLKKGVWDTIQPTFHFKNKDPRSKWRLKPNTWTHEYNTAFMISAPNYMKGCILKFNKHTVINNENHYNISAYAECTRKSCHMKYHFEITQRPTNSDVKVLVR